MGSIAIDSSPWISTPLLESRGLSQAAGCRIFLKLETLQPSGSFKSRGIGNFIVCRLEELKAKNITTPPHFYCPSGGNAGLACVVAAVSLGYKATIVVPLTCSSIMIEKLRKAGATDVVVHGKTLAEATDYLQEKILPMDPTGIQVPPFDHPDVWAGNGTVIDELPAQLGEQPDAVICSVGGGGLLCGIIEGLDRLGWHDTEVVAVETKGADSLSLSLKQGELITMSAMTSSATSLGCVKVAKKCFEDGQRHNVRSVVLEDIEAEMGCVRLADEERIIVELACGVNIAMCYDGRLVKTLKSKKFTEETKVVIILCGGSNVTSDMLSGWRRDLQIRTWSSSPDFKLETAWGSETITISEVESATKAKSITDEKTTVAA